MDISCVSHVFLLLLVFHVPRVSSHCGGSGRIRYVKFPDSQTLLSLGTFNEYIVNRTLNEMYFATPRPAPFEPDRSYKSTITTIPGTNSIVVKTSGVSTDGDPVCGTTEFHPGHIPDRTLFYYPDNEHMVQAYWSHCPTSYIISLRCLNYIRKTKGCSLNDVYIGVYILGSIDDVPISDITKELCKTTNVKFGAQDLQWFFTYGDQMLC